MKNTLTDLHNHLMAQIERLGDEDLASDPEKLAAEIQRSKSMTQLAGAAADAANGAGSPGANVVPETCPHCGMAVLFRHQADDEWICLRCSGAVTGKEIGVGAVRLDDWLHDVGSQWYE